MVGLLEEKQVDREEFPAVIWRNRYENSMVYAVNGDYLSDLTGLGILDAFVYESSDYVLYPVINARNTTIVNYPDLTEENTERLQSIYSRDSAAVMSDVMWPDLTAMSLQNEMKLTFCLIFSGQSEPDQDKLVFYLQQMKEIGAEAGRTLERSEGIQLSDKLDREQAFFQAAGSSYAYTVWYAGAEIDEEIGAAVEAGQLENVRTLVCRESESYPVVAYYNDLVTVQCATGTATSFTYSEEFRKRSMDTALGYSNVLVEMNNVLWPESEKDEWQNYFREVTSNLDTYWKDKNNFESTVLTESDTRVRNFLNMEYTQVREDNRITLCMTGTTGDGWFLLRTHGEKLDGAEGADYQQIEEEAWLIHALSEEVFLYLKEVDL
jgi:hypothetical protein